MKCINLECQKEIGDALFCPYCGTKQEKPKVFCSKCGAEMDDDAIYCNNCGTKSFFAEQRELEEKQKREAEAKAKAERDKQNRLNEELESAKRKAAEEEKERLLRIEQERKAKEEIKKKEDEKRQTQAQIEYKDLMSDLVPDLIQKNEKLEFHLPFVKKFARDSGWDENEIVSALSDFLKMYDEFQQEHAKGEGFKSSEKRFLTFQANLAHIDQSILDKIF